MNDWRQLKKGDIVRFTKEYREEYSESDIPHMVEDVKK